MVLKYLFDRVVSFIGLLFLWPVLALVAILIKVKMPGGPVFLCSSALGGMASYLSAINFAR